MCQRGLKSQSFHTTNWYTQHYKTASYFPNLQQAGMLFANTPKVKRCLSRKRTIEILLWVWTFCSVWWNGYGVVGAWLRTQCDELRLYVWPIFWCVNIVTCRNLPLWKMPLNYWYSSMAIPVNKQANHSPPFWGGVGGEAVTLSLTCFLPAI